MGVIWPSEIDMEVRRRREQLLACASPRAAARQLRLGRGRFWRRPDRDAST